MSGYVSLGGKYAGVATKQLNNGATAFYILFRDIESKAKRKQVGTSPEMTKVKALQLLYEKKEEIRAKKELSKNPNSSLPKILRKKVDKTTYTLNDLADYYFEHNKKKSSLAMKSKYKYHFSSEAFAQKNINLITEDDIEDFLKRKSEQRADNRRSNSENTTKLNGASISTRKSRSLDLTLEEREQREYGNNNIEINKLELIIEADQNANKNLWREINKVKFLKEKNRVLSYRLFSEKAKQLLRDKTLTIDEIKTLRGTLSRKSVKELLLLASIIINYNNRYKKINVHNPFHILKGDKFYISVNNVKPRYLTKEEIKSYLSEIKVVTYNQEVHKNLYLISLLALSTAARRDTILSIKIEDIDLVNDNIQLRNFKTEKNFTSTISNPEIKREIIRVIDNRPPNSFLFENPGTELRITVFPPKMKEVLDYTVNCHKSYLNHLTIKEFRNTVASHLAMKGTSIPQIAQILNHSSTRSTEIYSQLAPSSAKQDVANFVSDFLEE